MVMEFFMRVRTGSFALPALAMLLCVIAPGISVADGLACKQCHGNLNGDKVLHAPSAGDECASCHVVVKGKQHPDQEQSVVFKDAGSKLCESCHEPLNTAKHVHGPVFSGECVLCHNPHGSANEKLLKKPGVALCLNCHEDKYKQKFMHGPVADGNCLICHDPHQSDNPYFLKIGLPTLCFSCHDASPMTGKSVHTPVAKGNCLACHDPHGSNHRQHLRNELTDAFYAPYDPDSYALCFDCHDKDLAVDKRTDSLTNFRDGDRNLHTVHVNISDKGRACKACHDHHAATQKKLIKRKVAGFGKWEIPINYTVSATGGTCIVGCHKPQTYDRTKIRRL